MKRHVLGIAAVVIAVGSSCSRSSDHGASVSVLDATSTAPSADAPTCAPTGGTNLLHNPSFEQGASLATGWTNESSTATEPTYTLSTIGVVDGELSQRMQYAGTAGDDGTRKAQFFQAPIDGVAPGDTVQFSICVSGDAVEALTRAYVTIGVEAFEADKTYISDVTSNITEVSDTPVRYTRDYTVPEGAAYLAVFVQSPEFADISSIDLYFDHASLVVV